MVESSTAATLTAPTRPSEPKAGAREGEPAHTALGSTQLGSSGGAPVLQPVRVDLESVDLDALLRGGHALDDVLVNIVRNELPEIRAVKERKAAAVAAKGHSSDEAPPLERGLASVAEFARARQNGVLGAVMKGVAHVLGETVDELRTAHRVPDDLGAFVEQQKARHHRKRVGRGNSWSVKSLDWFIEKPKVNTPVDDLVGAQFWGRGVPYGKAADRLVELLSKKVEEANASGHPERYHNEISALTMVLKEVMDVYDDFRAFAVESYHVTGAYFAASMLNLGIDVWNEARGKKTSVQQGFKGAMKNALRAEVMEMTARYIGMGWGDYAPNNPRTWLGPAVEVVCGGTVSSVVYGFSNAFQRWFGMPPFVAKTLVGVPAGMAAGFVSWRVISQNGDLKQAAFRSGFQNTPPRYVFGEFAFPPIRRAMLWMLHAAGMAHAPA